MKKPRPKGSDLFETAATLVSQWGEAEPEERKRAARLMEQSGLAADAGPLGLLLTGLIRALALAQATPDVERKGKAKKR